MMMMMTMTLQHNELLLPFLSFVTITKARWQIMYAFNSY